MRDWRSRLERRRRSLTGNSSQREIIWNESLKILLTRDDPSYLVTFQKLYRLDHGLSTSVGGFESGNPEATRKQVGSSTSLLVLLQNGRLKRWRDSGIVTDHVRAVGSVE